MSPQVGLVVPLIAGVPSSQALPGFLVTAPPSVCVPDAIGALAVCIQNQTKKKESGTRHGPSLSHNVRGLLMFV